MDTESQTEVKTNRQNRVEQKGLQRQSAHNQRQSVSQRQQQATAEATALCVCACRGGRRQKRDRRETPEERQKRDARRETEERGQKRDGRATATTPAARIVFPAFAPMAFYFPNRRRRPTSAPKDCLGCSDAPRLPRWQFTFRNDVRSRPRPWYHVLDQMVRKPWQNAQT